MDSIGYETSVTKLSMTFLCNSDKAPSHKSGIIKTIRGVHPKAICQQKFKHIDLIYIVKVAFCNKK